MTTAAALYPILGIQPPGNFFIPDTTQRQTLGTIIDVVDPYWGGGEMIYLKANATITPGQVLTWDVNFNATVATNAANTGKPIATASFLATASMASGAFFWAGLSGNHLFKAVASVAAGTTFGIDNTTGGSINANGAGRQVLNGISVAPSSTTVVKSNAVTLNGSPILQVQNTDGWFVGGTLSGTGISGTITAIDPNSRTVTMSANATATGSISATLTYTGFIIGYVSRAFLQGAIT